MLYSSNIEQDKPERGRAIDDLITQKKTSSIPSTRDNYHQQMPYNQQSYDFSSASINRHNPCSALHPAGDKRH
jgi:hypothetical protein